jgi:hypothetical protein
MSPDTAFSRQRASVRGRAAAGASGIAASRASSETMRRLADCKLARGNRPHRTVMTRHGLLAMVVLTASIGSSLAAQSIRQGPATTSVVKSGDSDLQTLERAKFEYQKQLEDEKLVVERLKAWLTGGSILIPLALGVFTLWWQTRTANAIKDREARDTFELKAVEILFSSDGAVGTKNRARALRSLFPGRLPENFGDGFEPTQFGGARYEAKLEVFKAACTKVTTPEDVYRVWFALFPGDKWIKPLVPGLISTPDSGNPNAG